jgi:hypothetical protein
MAIIPNNTQFRGDTTGVAIVEKGSSQTNSRAGIFTMDDIVETVAQETQTIGTIGQVPYSNASADDFDYSAGLVYEPGVELTVDGEVNATSLAGDGTLITNIPDIVTTVAHPLDRKVTIVDASSNAVTTTLPDVTISLGREFTIVAYDATNTVTIDTTGGQDIRRTVLDVGTTSIVVAAGEIYTVVGTGVYWQVI